MGYHNLTVTLSPSGVVGKLKPTPGFSRFRDADGFHQLNALVINPKHGSGVAAASLAPHEHTEAVVVASVPCVRHCGVIAVTGVATLLCCPLHSEMGSPSLNLHIIPCIVFCSLWHTNRSFCFLFLTIDIYSPSRTFRKMSLPWWKLPEPP